ncbi:hypothetical protein [Cypionkella sp.]|uniref:hypothetical protein n=1 Tax=Cypionkella sp. TaxID=2811411 RepID=UPI00261BE9C2|nr:hypothetical protein [Cypionkella sp.]MDB5663644.1 hypothetical protein [Cypionkella sp.]
MRDEVLWQRMQAADFLTVADLRLRTSWPYGGKPLSDHVKLEIIRELRRFIYLLTVSDEPLVPSHFVALAIQNLHDLSSKSLSQTIGNRRLSLRPIQIPAAMQAGYVRALELRAKEFGAADPEHIWPSPFSLKLQLLGWGALAAGIVLGISARFGSQTTAVSLILLLIGGFLRFTEGPWPKNLPFRKGFVAKLDA